MEHNFHPPAHREFLAFMGARAQHAFATEQPAVAAARPLAAGAAALVGSAATGKTSFKYKLTYFELPDGFY